MKTHERLIPLDEKLRSMKQWEILTALREVISQVDPKYIDNTITYHQPAFKGHTTACIAVHMIYHIYGYEIDAEGHGDEDIQASAFGTDKETFFDVVYALSILVAGDVSNYEKAMSPLAIYVDELFLIELPSLNNLNYQSEEHYETLSKAIETLKLKNV